MKELMEMWGNEALQHTHIGDTIIPQHTHIGDPDESVHSIMNYYQ